MKTSASSLLFLASLVLVLAVSSVRSLRPGDCEVCVAVMTRFEASLDKDEKTDTGKIEKRFKEFCKDLKLKENRFVSETA